MTYRPEIDGLRAIAVFAVILFHADTSYLPGGYLGVDIFFVISGYLITSIIHPEIANNSFSYINFYFRRAKRLLPALFFTVLCSCVAAWFILLPSDMKDFGQSIVAVMGFASNVLFWLESGYFDKANELKPLLHTWSLAVEEQFYLLFPIALLSISKLKYQVQILIICALGVLSLLAAHIVSPTLPSSVFYLLPFRGWELLAGSILYFIKPYFDKVNPRYKLWIANVSFGSTLLHLFLFDQGIPAPSLYSFVLILSTALVIATTDVSSISRAVLTAKPVVKLGLWSYSAYLIHQPLFSFYKHLSFGDITPFSKFSLIFATFILASLVYRYIEQPCRALKPTSYWLTGNVVLFLAFLSFGVFIVVKEGVIERVSRKAQLIEASANDYNPDRWRCQSSPKRFLNPDSACVLGLAGREIGVFMGDSHTDAIAPALSEELKKRGIALRHLWHNSCPPIVGLERADVKKHRCSEYNQISSEFVLSSAAIEYVVMAAWWPQYYEGAKFSNFDQDKSDPYVVPAESDKEFSRGSRDLKKAIALHFSETVHKYVAAGKKVVIVHPIPEMTHNVPRYHSRKVEFVSTAEDYRIPIHEYMHRVKGVERMFDSVRPLSDVYWVNSKDFLCDDKYCFGTKGNVSFYRDSHHLTKSGAVPISKAIVELITNAK